MSNFKEKIYKKLDIEPDDSADSMIEIRGRTSMALAGCEKILVYRSDLIMLALSEGVVSVIGDSLMCSSYCGGGVRIEGTIRSVVFSEDEE